jgi:hypothetical protein
VWTGRWDADCQTVFETTMAPWQLVSAHVEDRPRDQVWQGQTALITLGARPDTPLLLAQQLTLPADKRHKLVLHWGRDPAPAAELSVFFRGELLWKKLIPRGDASQPWQVTELDLMAYAGQSGWLLFHYASLEGETSWLRLGKAEVVAR